MLDLAVFSVIALAAFNGYKSAKYAVKHGLL